MGAVSFGVIVYEHGRGVDGHVVVGKVEVAVKPPVSPAVLDDPRAISRRGDPVCGIGIQVAEIVFGIRIVPSDDGDRMVQCGRFIARGDVLVHVLRIVGVEIPLLEVGEVGDGHCAVVHQRLLDGVQSGGIEYVILAVIRLRGAEGLAECGRVRKLVNILHIGSRLTAVRLARPLLVFRIVFASIVGNQTVGKVFFGHGSLPAGQCCKGVRVVSSLVQHLLSYWFLHALPDLHGVSLAYLIVKIHRRCQQR